MQSCKNLQNSMKNISNVSPKWRKIIITWNSGNSDNIFIVEVVLMMLHTVWRRYNNRWNPRKIINVLSLLVLANGLASTATNTCTWSASHHCWVRPRSRRVVLHDLNLKKQQECREKLKKGTSILTLVIRLKKYVLFVILMFRNMASII